jgi:hypothetical protein
LIWAHPVMPAFTYVAEHVTPGTRRRNSRRSSAAPVWADQAHLAAQHVESWGSSSRLQRRRNTPSHVRRRIVRRRPHRASLRLGIDRIVRNFSMRKRRPSTPIPFLTVQHGAGRHELERDDDREH